MFFIYIFNNYIQQNIAIIFQSTFFGKYNTVFTDFIRLGLQNPTLYLIFFLQAKNLRLIHIRQNYSLKTINAKVNT